MLLFPLRYTADPQAVGRNSDRNSGDTLHNYLAELSKVSPELGNQYGYFAENFEALAQTGR